MQNLKNSITLTEFFLFLDNIFNTNNDIKENIIINNKTNTAYNLYTRLKGIKNIDNVLFLNLDLYNENKLEDFFINNFVNKKTEEEKQEKKKIIIFLKNNNELEANVLYILTDLFYLREIKTKQIYDNIIFIKIINNNIDNDFPNLNKIENVNYKYKYISFNIEDISYIEWKKKEQQNNIDWKILSLIENNVFQEKYNLAFYSKLSERLNLINKTNTNLYNNILIDMFGLEDYNTYNKYIERLEKYNFKKQFLDTDSQINVDIKLNDLFLLSYYYFNKYQSQIKVEGIKKYFTFLYELLLKNKLDNDKIVKHIFDIIDVIKNTKEEYLEILTYIYENDIFKNEEQILEYIEKSMKKEK